MKYLKKTIIAGISALATALFSQAYADGILRGVPYPLTFKYQIEERIVYSENEKGIKTATDTIFLKYRNEDILFSIGMPYKYVEQHSSLDGFGDASVLLGLIRKIEVGKDNLHLLPYCSLTFPTAETKEIALGNERLDEKLGIAATYLTEDKRREIDFVLERIFTGENKENINSPDETYSGILAGGEILPQIRVAAGFTNLRKDNGDYLSNLRTFLRLTSKDKKYQLEFFADKSIYNKGIPKGDSTGIITRRNF
ncbi:hypothetical protein HYT26_04545 [Candidatus Pacearchaeota archaeon]|nr:hypothetical protein [Candidatus Pacearchaeota archaeon]